MSSFDNLQIANNTKFIWEECLKIIKNNVTPMTFNTWFLPIKPLELNHKTLIVQLPGNFFWEWITGHYNSLINKTIKEILGNNGELKFVISENPDFEDEKTNSVPEVKLKPTQAEAIKKINHHENNLNSKYLFDNFIKGEGNQLARAAAFAISENPGNNSFNPFFVYGGVGLGKTHLIQAIGNKISETYPEKKIIYLSSDIFTVEFVDAIQSSKVNEFTSFYKSMDVLIIDDIQFLIGKEKTQDLFFHIFNTLHQANKQIILSSDKPPKDLKGMDDRLISRFNWGLTADIQPPDLETRIAILTKKADSFGMNVSPLIIEYIANHITSNIRELEGCLIKLLANVSLNSKEIEIDYVKKIVKEISTSKKVNISIDLITKISCEYLSVDENKVRDKTRKQEVVNARQISMYLSKELTKSSLKTIGLHFGGRDHSTVIHACSTIEENISINKNFKETIDIIKNKIEIACA